MLNSLCAFLLLIARSLQLCCGGSAQGLHMCSWRGSLRCLSNRGCAISFLGLSFRLIMILIAFHRIVVGRIGGRLSVGIVLYTIMVRMFLIWQVRDQRPESLGLGYDRVERWFPLASNSGRKLKGLSFLKTYIWTSTVLSHGCPNGE